jgi:SAM-dependent methyltransferase
MVDPKLHWEDVYRRKKPTEVSWYRPHLETSLELIEATGAAHDAAIIDIGAGESTLIDDLLARGQRNVFAMDLSATALGVAKERLRGDAASVRWLCGDVLTYPFECGQFDIWHDRAVFHFLTESADRIRYVRQVSRAVRAGGHVIVATFGPQGPSRCSGLEVMRYDADALHAEFGRAFRLVLHRTELHRTPAGSTQQFTYCYCRVSGA